MHLQNPTGTRAAWWWCVCNWGWPTRGPALPASQRLFIKAMHYLEENEDEALIVALHLPLTYTGQTLHISEKITNKTQWNENLDALLNAIENEKGIPFADLYISLLHSYKFIETATVRDYTRQIVYEEH